MPFLEADFKDNNQFLLSSYGNVQSLGFKGEQNFINKSYNLCHNYGITNGRLIYLQPGLSYILTTKEKIYNGLRRYFESELKTNKIVPLIKDCWNEDESEYIIEYNEPAIDQIAQEKAQKFIDKYIKEDNFMIFIPREINAQFYETTSILVPKAIFGKNSLNDQLGNDRDDQ